jgi:hypothetical protein
MRSGKTKEILYRTVIFLGDFSHCGYKLFLKKLGNFVLIVGIREKNDQKMEKINKIYKPQNWKKQKKHWYRGIYMWALSIKYGKHVVKLMMFYCKTLYICGKPQSARLASGANMLDLRSEALA